MKTKRKLNKSLEKLVQDLQFDFELSESLIDSEEQEVLPGDEKDEFQSFVSFFNNFVIEPYGARIFETLHELI